MAVSGIKGTGIGQVSMPSRADVEQMIRGNREGIGDIAASYLQGLTSGTGERADRFLPVADFAPDPQTRFGQLFDLPGIAESAAKGGRLVTGLPVAIGGTIAESLGLPSESGFESSMPSLINEEMARIQSEISPFQEEIRRQKSANQAGMPTTPGLGSFTTADGEETRDQADPTQSGQRNIGLSDDEEAAMAGADAAGAQSATEDIIRTSVQDYLSMTGKESKATTTEEYIKEFADATGLDVSGKPDKSTALMTFGLALMQNKAGKGFDVGKMLGAVGEAGEKAMPAFEKAKSEARALRAKAGEYALGRTREDEKLARQRGGYYIVPKSTGLAGRIKAFTQDSKRADLNAFELDALYENASFRQNFDIIPASEYNDVYKELSKKPEYGDMYASSYDNISLFNDAPDDLQIGVQRVNANYKGPSKPSRGYFNPGEYDVYAGRLNSMKSGLDKTGTKLAEAYSIVNAGETTTPKQIGDAITSFGRAFGIKFGEGATDRDKVLRIINVISAERAPEILGEAGKTISDADRVRVNAIVGTLGLTEDPEKLKEALNDIYDTIVIGGYKDVEQGFSTLNMYAGVTPQSRPKSLKKNESGTFDATVE